MQSRVNNLINQYISGDLEDLSQGLASSDIQDNEIEAEHLAMACDHKSEVIQSGQALKILLTKRHASGKPFNVQERERLRQLINFLKKERADALHLFQESIHLLENILSRLKPPIPIQTMILAFADHQDLFTSTLVTKELKHVSEQTAFQKRLKELKNKKFTPLQLDNYLILAAKKHDLFEMRALLVVKGVKNVSNYLVLYQKYLGDLKNKKLSASQLKKALDVAEDKSDSTHEVLALLVLCDDISEDSLISSVRRMNHEHTVQLFCAWGRIERRTLKTLLLQAIDAESIVKVKVLLQHPGISTALLAYALSAAIKTDQSAIVQALLEHPFIDPNLEAYESDPPLITAALKENLDIIRLLIEHKTTNVNIRGPNDCSLTALQIAVYKEHLGMARLLIAHEDIDINSRSSNSNSALLIAQTFHNIPLMNLLLKNKNIQFQNVYSDPYCRLEESYKAQLGAKKNRSLLWLDKTEGLPLAPALPEEKLSAALIKLQQASVPQNTDRCFARLFSPSNQVHIEKFFSEAIHIFNKPEIVPQDIQRVLRIIQNAPITSADAKLQSYGDTGIPEYCTAVGFIEDDEESHWGKPIGTSFKKHATTQSGFLMHHLCMMLIEIKKHPNDFSFQEKAVMLYQELLKIHPHLPLLHIFDLRHGFQYVSQFGQVKQIKYDALPDACAKKLNFILHHSYQTGLSSDSQRYLRQIVDKMTAIIMQHHETSWIIHPLMDYLIDGLKTKRWNESWCESGAGLNRVCIALTEINSTHNAKTIEKIVAHLVKKGSMIGRYITEDKAASAANNETLLSRHYFR